MKKILIASLGILLMTSGMSYSNNSVKEITEFHLKLSRNEIDKQDSSHSMKVIANNDKHYHISGKKNMTDKYQWGFILRDMDTQEEIVMYQKQEIGLIHLWKETRKIYREKIDFYSHLLNAHKESQKFNSVSATEKPEEVIIEIHPTERDSDSFSKTFPKNSPNLNSEYHKMIREGKLKRTQYKAEKMDPEKLARKAEVARKLVRKDARWQKICNTLSDLVY